jgi:beta-mannanase
VGRRPLHALIVAVLSAALSVGLVLVPSAAGAAVRPTGPLSLASGAYFGALVNPDRSTPSSTPAEVTALESEVGRTLDIVNHFYTYNQAVGSTGEVQDIAAGRIPMITWGATSTRSINNGSQDAYIRQQANRIKALGGTVFLRYFHEPEGDYRGTMVQSAAAYITAWKRAQNIFRTAGVTNVVWVWCTTAYSFRVTPTRDPRTFYPGDAFVDWIGADGYNFAPGKPGAKWNSFTTVFSRWYSWAAQRPKPLMAAEYGVMEDTSQPTRKAGWYNDMRAAVKTTFPLLQAVIAWSTENTKEGNVYDWNVDSSPNSLDAWSAMANDPYFDPRGL